MTPKTKTILINTFDGGITRDLRLQTHNKFKISKNFDIFSDSKRMQPFRSLEANENKAYGIVQFIQTNNQIYGLGRVGTTDQKAKIYKKGVNLITTDWTEDQDVEGLGARNEKVFFEYKDYLYFWEAGARLTRHGDITSTATNATFKTIAYTNIAQPVHHPADDIAYFFSDNKVHSLSSSDVGDFNEDALELPDNLIITCACAYGDYLAIGCKSTEKTGKSIVFLWDRDSSLTTISEKIDWGAGELVVLQVLDGILIGISNVNSDNIFGEKQKIHIKGYAGSLSFLQELDLDTTTTGGTSPCGCNGHWAIQNGKLYFDVQSGVLTNDYTGIWVVGRHEAGSPFSITMAYKVDTAATVDTIQGFNLFQDYLFVAHSSDGSVDRTNDAVVYPTASYESQIFTGDDSSQTKKLMGTTVMHEPLPTAGQVLLYYKKDEETTWTLIFTNTTDDSIRHSAINISGETLPEFKEIQFKIESKGGSVISGLKFKYIDKDDDLF